MAKRKAKDLDDGVLADEPRRSGRRVSTSKEPVVVEKTKAAGTSKKGGKAEKSRKIVSVAINGKEENSAEKASYFHHEMLSILPKMEFIQTITCIPVTHS